MSKDVMRPLTLSVPLRSDFIATVQVPRDLTETEARRLADMILTLPIPATPTDTGGTE